MGTEPHSALRFFIDGGCELTDGVASTNGSV